MFKRNRKHHIIYAFLSAFFCIVNMGFVKARETNRIPVRNATDTAKATQAAKPGDTLIMQSRGMERQENNIYRHNTFYACQGTLTLRHGNHALP